MLSVLNWMLCTAVTVLIVVDANLEGTVSLCPNPRAAVIPTSIQRVRRPQLCAALSPQPALAPARHLPDPDPHPWSYRAVCAARISARFCFAMGLALWSFAVMTLKWHTYDAKFEGQTAEGSHAAVFVW